MDKDNKSAGDIRIDYDNISVTDIMAQIKERAASYPEEQPGEALESDAEFGEFPQFHPEPVEEGKKARIKRIVLRMMRPFSPLIKFLVLPVHQQVVDTQQILDKTNRRLDFLFEQYRQDRINTARQIQLLKEYVKLLHNLSHNIVVEMTKLKIEEENIKLKSRILEKDFEFLQKKEKALEEELFK